MRRIFSGVLFASFAGLCSAAPAAAQVDPSFPDFVILPIDPPDIIGMFDWSAYYNGSGEGGAGQRALSKQPPEQILLNRARMTLAPSNQALKIAYDAFVPPLRAQNPLLGQMAETALNDPATSRAFAQTLRQHGLNPENFADALTAYTLTSLGLQKSGKADLNLYSREQIQAVRRSLEEMWVTHLPPSVPDATLRAMMEEARAEYSLQRSILDASESDAADDRAYLHTVLIERAEDFLDMNLAATEVDPVQGFVER